jgi:hypothetical protein
MPYAGILSNGNLQVGSIMFSPNIQSMTGNMFFSRFVNTRLSTKNMTSVGHTIQNPNRLVPALTANYGAT